MTLLVCLRSDASNAPVADEVDDQREPLAATELQLRGEDLELIRTSLTIHTELTECARAIGRDRPLESIDPARRRVVERVLTVGIVEPLEPLRRSKGLTHPGDQGGLEAGLAEPRQRGDGIIKPIQVKMRVDQFALCGSLVPFCPCPLRSGDSRRAR